MTLENHLVALEKRRESLKKEIALLEACPAIDQLKLAGLKRQKLTLKDEITQMRNGLKEAERTPMRA